VWFAVAYPAGGRLDLGLLEAVMVTPLAVAFLRGRRKPRPVGFFIGTMCVYYAVLRFGLDFLRANDVIYADRRYCALTPAQWGMGVLFCVGLYFSSRVRSNNRDVLGSTTFQ
jgi:phosphatidylglycerol:prolipoprotein diacylglycerol transferase